MAFLQFFLGDNLDRIVAKNVVGRDNPSEKMVRVAEVCIYNAVPNLVPLMFCAWDKFERAVVFTFYGNNVAGF
jgi:hypothetical protein